MSRDIFIQELPAGIRSTDDIPDNWIPQGLGIERDNVIDAIERLAPTADFTDPVWGVVEMGGVSIEVNIEPESLVDHLALHVRGDKAEADRFIAALLTSLGLRAALDSESPTGIFRA